MPGSSAAVATNGPASSRSVIACPRSPCPMLTRRSRSASRIRSSTATRRRRTASSTALSSAAIVPGRASYVARASPRWPSSSNADAATDGCDRHRPTPRARGWSDDRRPDATSGRRPERLGELERLEVGSEQSDGAADDQVTADQLSLGRRLRQPRTIISIVLPLVLLVLFARALPGFKVDDILGYVAAANKTLLFAAFLVFYLGFPLRGLRWAILIRGTGYRLKVRDSTEIILISGWSTAWCRPSSATSTARTCSRSTARSP